MEQCCGTGQDTDDSIIRRMRFAYWITNNAEERSEYVTLTAFARQQRLRERARMLVIRRATFPVLLLYPLYGQFETTH